MGANSTYKSFEQTPLKLLSKEDRIEIKTLLKTRMSVGFNSIAYDLPMISAALMGYPCAKLKAFSDELILSGKPSWQVCQQEKLRVPSYDHIDLINVIPGIASLKLYGGRLHAQKLQDLPYDPSTKLTSLQIDEIREYCKNDVALTKLLYDYMRPQLKLREAINKEFADYNLDVRSKGDAQIAETLIRNQCEDKLAITISKPPVDKSLTFRYDAPAWVYFDTEPLQTLLEKITDDKFKLTDKGSVTLPEWLTKYKLDIGGLPLKIGIGGLHSQEKTIYYESNDEYELIDQDVASYYPSIILNNNFNPQAYGKVFGEVYREVFDKRLSAKREGNMTISDTYKIVLNSSFGKMGNKYSTLYDPKLFLQVTLTGQLALLMLIEQLHTVAQVRVISANTDGVLTYVPKQLKTTSYQRVLDHWQAETGFVLEDTHYLKYLGRDVNNYLAVKIDGKTKGKGVFAPQSIVKNPDNLIIYEAVAALLTDGIAIEDTIEFCTDITKFLSVRTVRGGAVHNWDYLGKVVRFYKAHDGNHPITYATNGNKVPKSDACQPLQDLPTAFPPDVDYAYYINEATKLLGAIDGKK
jgi:hypothetical protein